MVDAGSNQPTPPFQTEQAKRIGASIISLDAGHSPFATHPAELAALILDGGTR